MVEADTWCSLISLVCRAGGTVERLGRTTVYFSRTNLTLVVWVLGKCPIWWEPPLLCLDNLGKERTTHFCQLMFPTEFCYPLHCLKWQNKAKQKKRAYFSRCLSCNTSCSSPAPLHFFTARHHFKHYISFPSFLCYLSDYNRSYIDYLCQSSFTFHVVRSQF